MNRFHEQRRRLLLLLSAMFTALLAVSAVIVYQAFDQLRYEAFYAQRVQAEEFAARVNLDFRRLIAAEEARPPTDYDFLVVSGERYVVRSPLSSLPPGSALPGVVGFFQVDAAGQFTTPLLPAEVTDVRALDLTTREYESRLALQQRLRQLLMVQALPEKSGVRVSEFKENGIEEEGIAQAEIAEDGFRKNEFNIGGVREKDVKGVELFDLAATVAFEADNDNRPAAPVDDVSANKALYSQLTDTERRKRKPDTFADRPVSSQLRRDYTLRTESAATELEAARQQAAPRARVEVVKKVAAPTGDEAQWTPRISAFESEVDPFTLEVLDGDHFLLYRKVWQDGQRLVQGAIIEQSEFLETLIDRPYAATLLAGFSDLVVAFEGEVLRVFGSRGRSDYTVRSSELEGELLLTTNLLAPANGLELAFSVADLPYGPGGVTLAWSAAIMFVLLCGGFATLNLLGRRQIQLAQQQEDFVSAVSHELKTPLTSIRMYGEMLKAGWVSEDKRRVYYDYIFNESERLSRMIGNVLELARFSRNKPGHRQLQPIAVRTLLDQLESKISSPLQTAELVLETDHESDALEAVVLADEDAFLQVMINLVDNAIKFSTDADKRAVVIGTRLDAGWLEFRVRDFGPGVARDQMQKIFKLFYRVENELTRETVGTGIGLALVRQLVDQMGGSVDVVNQQPGAEFRVRLRLADQPENA